MICIPIIEVSEQHGLHLHGPGSPGMGTLVSHKSSLHQDEGDKHLQVVLRLVRITNGLIKVRPDAVTDCNTGRMLPPMRSGIIPRIRRVS